MPLSRSNRRAPQGKMTWNTELRLGLLVMKDDLELTWTDMILVFNRVFKKQIVARGLLELTYGQLTAQYNEKEKPRFAEARAVPAGQRKEMKSQITQVIEQQGLKAQPYPMPTPPTTPLGQEALSQRQGSHATISRTEDTILSSGSGASLRSQIKVRPDPIVVVSRQERHATPSRFKTIVRRPSHRTPDKRQPSAIARAIPLLSQHRMDKLLPFASTASSSVPLTLDTRRKRRKSNATIPYRTSGDKVIYLTPEEKAETDMDLVPISEDAAHPNVPLLFRFWDEDSLSPLTDAGFIAKRFSYTIISPPPPPELDSVHFPWSDFCSHLNKDECYSPFISTSNDFTWILRTAMKRYKHGRDVRISIIDPTKMDRRAIFHAQPIHNELRKKKPFTKGAFMYKGMRDFMVWNHIPRSAVISTITTETIFELVAKDRQLGAILRLQQLSEGKSYEKIILPTFEAQAIILDTLTIKAMARLCKVLSLNLVQIEMVASLVTDLIKSFALKLPSLCDGEWQQQASSTFAQAMCTLYPDKWNLEAYFNMQWAFLDGCRWAQGEFNSRQKPRMTASMLRRGQKRGLLSPIDVLAARFSAANMGPLLHEQKQQDLLLGRSNIQSLGRGRQQVQPMLEDAECEHSTRANDVKGDESTMDHRAHAAIVIDSDSGSEYYEDEDEAMSDYEP